MKYDDDIVIICGPGPLSAYEGHIPGSIEDVCSQCGVTVIIAPTGQELRTQSTEPVYLLCPNCGLEAMKEPGRKLAAPTPEQIEELGRFLIDKPVNGKKP